MRRTFRRHIRKALAQEVPPILQEANCAFDRSEHGRAGELFERIADTAAARNGPRAPIFFLQAGHARLLAGQTPLGMPSLRRGTVQPDEVAWLDEVTAACAYCGGPIR